jgi:ABC-type transport system involved in cytochrome c biogenesis permease subunit
MNNLWGYASLVVYLASFACYAIFLYGNERWVGRLGTLFLAAGVLLHYASLMERSRWTHSVPYDDLYGSMSLFAWLVGVTYLGLEMFHRQRSVGAFVLPILILWTAFVVLLAPHEAPALPPARGPLFALHVTLNMLAYAAFALSFALSLIYLIQNRVLKAKRPGLVFWRFPSLDALELMSRSSVWVGLASLATGVTFGFVWEHRLDGHYFVADPKVWVTLLIFALYLGYEWLSKSAGWRGSRAATICALNFVVVLFSYTFVNMYLTNFHRYL